MTPLYFFSLFRGSNICRNHIQSNFYCNGHSDSPYIDSCLNLPTTGTFFCPQGPENDLENEDLKNYDLESDDLFTFAFSFTH